MKTTIHRTENTIKKFGLLSLVTLAVLLAGCGSQSNSGSGETEQNAPETSSDPAEESSAAVAEEAALDLSGRWLVSGGTVPYEATITHNSEGGVTLTDSATGLGEVTLTGSADSDTGTFSSRIEIETTSTFYEYTLTIISPTTMEDRKSVV